MKSFTVVKLIDSIINNPKKSRREYMLNLLEAEGKKSSSNYRFKLWSRKQSDGKNHPILLDSDVMSNQRLNYLPARQVVQAGIGILLLLVLYQSRGIGDTAVLLII